MVGSSQCGANPRTPNWGFAPDPAPLDTEATPVGRNGALATAKGVPTPRAFRPQRFQTKGLKVSGPKVSGPNVFRTKRFRAKVSDPKVSEQGLEAPHIHTPDPQELCRCGWGAQRRERPALRSRRRQARVSWRAARPMVEVALDMLGGRPPLSFTEPVRAQ